MIQQLEVMNGHPLLQQAALDAVRQWRYQPTLLNGDPWKLTRPLTYFFSQPVVRAACRSWDRRATPRSNISKHSR